MSKINKILLAVAIVLSVILLALLAFKWTGSSNKDITAVYLKTGDLYFGELTTFPTFGLKHPYLFTVNKSNKKNPVNVQKFDKGFWGQEDYIKNNRDEVVWTAKLKPDSQLVKLIETNPDLIPPQRTQQSSQAPKGGNGTKMQSSPTPNK